VGVGYGYTICITLQIRSGRGFLYRNNFMPPSYVSGC